jgi:hypothetical protein
LQSLKAAVYAIEVCSYGLSLSQYNFIYAWFGWHVLVFACMYISLCLCVKHTRQ